MPPTAVHKAIAEKLIVTPMVPSIVGIEHQGSEGFLIGEAQKTHKSRNRNYNYCWLPFLATILVSSKNWNVKL